MFVNIQKFQKNFWVWIIRLVVFLMVMVFIIPLSYAFITSLKEPIDYLKNPVGLVFQPTIQNFINAWQKADFGEYILNSIMYTSVSTFLSLFMALLMAFPIARNYIKFSGALLSFLMVGMFLPDGSIPMFQILLRLGLYDTRVGYIISLIAVGGVPLMFFTSYLKGIPRELDEAAIIDGASYMPFFFRVIVPLAKPAISSMIILTAINSWNDITRSIIYLSDSKLFPITKGLWVFSGQYAAEWTELMAALVIVASPLIILYIFLQKYIIAGMTAGAVKS